MHRLPRWLSLLGLLFTIQPPAPASAVVFDGTRVIVRFGDPLPEGAGEFFSLGTAPRISPNGQVVFGAQTSAGGQSSGILRGSGPNDLATIALEDWPTPDANGYFPALWHWYTAINANDEVAFWTTLSGALGGAAQGIFRGTGGPAGLTKIIRTGDVLPDDGGAASPTTDALAMNNAGEVAFTASLGVYRGNGTPDGVVEIAGYGDDAPGGDGTLAGPSGARLAVNDAGQVAFNGTISGSSADRGIFRGDGGALEQIARDGAASPDGNGAMIVALNPVMNSEGLVAFAANLYGTSGGTADAAGLFVGDGTNLALIARRGALTPSGNGRFLDFDPSLAINDSGQVLFFSTITGASGGSTAGLFRGDGEQLVEIARASDPTPSGLGVLRSFQANTSSPPTMALNEKGQVAFVAGIDLQNGGAPNDAGGLFLHDDETGLHEVVRSGDALLDLGTVETVTFAGGTDNESSGLSDDGSVAYGALNAVLIAPTVAPEPDAALLGASTIIALSLLSSRRRDSRSR